jgi:hypothetical protein
MLAATMHCLSIRRTLAVVSLLAFAGCQSSDDSAGPPAPGNPIPALRAVPDPVLGGRIVDASGREVLLRGVNVNALVPCVGAAACSPYLHSPQAGMVPLEAADAIQKMRTPSDASKAM